MKIAFITRHEPTPAQHQIAADWGGTLHSVGDIDAFAGAFELRKRFEALTAEGYEAFAVVHPLLALYAAEVGDVCVFENANRAPEGAKPQFEAKALWFYNRRGVRCEECWEWKCGI